MKTNFIYPIWAAVGRSLLLLGFSLVALSRGSSAAAYGLITVVAAVCCGAQAELL